MADPSSPVVIPGGVARWARRATRARNDLAHEGRTPSHRDEELIAVGEVTTAVVILNLLHELGLPADRQREIVREHPQLKATSRAAHAYLGTPGG
ncbi:HEPN domain-containing protein [Streptomyces diastaticus]|uniref:HEPN domain-containing protein n=1 Tax=Streptomyces diastaticus TaxID=1956 RepID=UPI00364AA110